MQSIKLQNIFLLLCLLFESVLSLPQCAESLKNDDQFQDKLEFFEEKLKYEEELNEFFNAATSNDVQTMDAVLDFLQTHNLENVSDRNVRSVELANSVVK